MNFWPEKERLCYLRGFAMANKRTLGLLTGGDIPGLNLAIRAISGPAEA